ncbi:MULTISPECIES: carbamoyl phosphate synthase small subunit [Sutcliffiella]|uniref:Carbamoyl phosphate synthase small chain n=1 Tax=Sutcliffiella cohnii TaxID=33932 RepID=A0A223KQL0_9BACI|nr:MULTISPECIES: carbamoyl phosphate synthase small subunit [Sutcliffiella]AST91613.1 carbamoyl phosphate synthase small subunit [Sutcliffiella cohnii]MED4014804.1 carbamoyl phosphate synthase small subunit [Sutcliffiella cohnii]WBL17446.1 carbamoyl phosphate synthase small subunit [Sutcliffiella sp. NC1]
MQKGYLLLETGHVFEGTLLGNSLESTGEVVFNTSMTGYQEIMSDPSYAGQIIVFCYPLVGNYGINEADFESNKLYIRGIVTGEICVNPQHFQMKETTVDTLNRNGINGLTGVDTRQIVKIIRKYGSVKGKITTNPSNVSFNADTTFFIDQVSTKSIQKYSNDGPHVVLIDYGSKKSILRALLNENCKVTVVPYNTTLVEIQKLNPDGIVLSNGPGDPMALSEYLKDIKLITEMYPTLGICLGHQLIALAHGGKTTKLPFGHRGGNHPVKEVETGKVFITSQNHGYVVDEKSIINNQNFHITYFNINDRTVEGIRHKQLPISSVQFHPEANPGPQDTEHIFKKFIKNIHQGELTYAAQ